LFEIEEEYANEPGFDTRIGTQDKFLIASMTQLAPHLKANIPDYPEPILDELSNTVGQLATMTHEFEVMSSSIKYQLLKLKSLKE